MSNRDMVNFTPHAPTLPNTIKKYFTPIQGGFNHLYELQLRGPAAAGHVAGGHLCESVNICMKFANYTQLSAPTLTFINFSTSTRSFSTVKS